MMKVRKFRKVVVKLKFWGLKIAFKLSYSIAPDLNNYNRFPSALALGLADYSIKFIHCTTIYKNIIQLQIEIFNKRVFMKFCRFLAASLVGICVCGSSMSAQVVSSAVQKLLKERTSLDFKVITNTNEPLKDASFVVVESPTKERIALLVSGDGSYIIPLADGIGIGLPNGALVANMQAVQKYNQDIKESAVLALFQKHANSVLKIPASKTTKRTTYMILDTTCPYCLQEIVHLDDYLKEANLEILMVGILGQKSQTRAAGYYQEFSSAKSREQKIALLKKVFRADYAPKVGNNALATTISEESVAAGVQGVPYIIRK